MYLLSNRNGKKPKLYVNYKPFVSIVIPTYNEEKHIEEKLRNTLNVDYPLNKTEIVVVDSSTDETPRIVKKWAKKYPNNIRLIREKNRRGLAAALNLAYSKANGEIIIKSDCDMLLDKNSIKQIVSNFSDPAVGAVSGKQLLIYESKHEKGYRSLIDLKRIVENQLDSIYLLEPFSAFRRDLVEPIDERSVADDAELGLKIRKKGYKVIFDPKAHCYERLPSSITNRLKIKQRRAQGHIKLLLENLDVLFNPKYGKYGLLVFPLNFYMIVVMPWLLVAFAVILPIVLYYLFDLYGIMFSIAFYTLLLISYIKGSIGPIAGLIEAQLALIIGFFNLILKGPQYMWKKVER